MTKRRVKIRAKSTQYYKNNPEARQRKAAYDTKYHDTPERRKYRAKLARVRRKKGVMGKGGKDVSHTRGGKYVLEGRRANRARQGAGGRPTKK